MDVSPSEKLILVMLAELHSRLGVTSVVDPDIVSFALREDRTWVLDAEYGAMLGSSRRHVSFQPEQAKRILDMWLHVEQSWDALPEEGRARVRSRWPRAEDMRFAGFDGTRDAVYWDIVRVYTGVLGRYPGLKDRRPPAGVSTEAANVRMLVVYESLKPGNGALLTAEALIPMAEVYHTYFTEANV